MADEQQIEDLFGGSDDEPVNGGSEDGDQQMQTRDTQPGFNVEDLEDDVPNDPAANGAKGLFGSDEEDEEDPYKTNRNEGYGSEDGDDQDAAPKRGRDVPVGPPMDVDVPLLPVPAPGSLCLMRTTNIASIQPRAFDPATYKREDEHIVDEMGRERVRLVNSVIRWRYRKLPDGREVPESNARFVRWEDGTVQLMLGDEVLDVTEQDITANNNYMFCQLRGIFQGLGHLDRRIALRPSSLTSGIHRKLRDVVDRKFQSKKDKVAAHGGLQNPELDKARREAAEEEKIRGREALQRKQARVMERAYGTSSRRAKPARLGADYLEEEQEWEEGGGMYDDDDGLTADQRARLSLSRNKAPGSQPKKRRAAGPSGAAGKRRRRGGDDDDDEEEEEESEVEFEEGEEEEEPEYQSSGGEEEDEEDGGKKSKSGGGGGAAAAAAPPPPSQAAALASSKVRQRRGVVLSDDDD